MDFSQVFPGFERKVTFFYQRPITVTPEFRALILQHYPQLATVQHAEFCWRVIQHILFSNYEDQFADESKEEVPNAKNEKWIVLAHIMVAHMAGKKPYDGRFRSGKCMNYFSGELFPLNNTSWSKLRGRARAINPSIDSELYEAADSELKKPSVERTEFFHNGKVANLMNKRHERDVRAASLKEQANTALPTHPAYEVAQFLNEQKYAAVSNIIRANWSDVEDELERMEWDTSVSPGTIRSARLNMASIGDDFHIYYKATEHSPRIYAMGATIHSLPRELRKRALAGMIELDLKACQLAVVAKYWNIPELHALLESQINAPNQETDIWRYIMEHSGAEEKHKPILKETVYSLVFGMGRRRLREQLIEGTYHYVKVKKSRKNKSTEPEKKPELKKEGVGEELGKKILKLPMFKSLLEARKNELYRLDFVGHLVDAFGNEIRPSSDFDELSVLAYVVQSYEVKVMKELFSIVRKKGNEIHVASWLHDGVTLYFGKTGEEERQIAQICKAVDGAARNLGIPTKLEVTRL